MDKKELVRLAIEARESSYSPYSNFRVGAALLTSGGKVYQGCNVENASYGAGICAERNAALRAVFEGEKRFSEIAVVGWHRDAKPEERGYAFPCGICRQALAEFLPEGEDLPVVCAAAQGEERLETTLRSLLPLGFGGEDLHFVK